MRIKAGVATDIGRVRERNEDAFLVEPPLYVVADGMGGARGGQVASQVALETIAELPAAGPARSRTRCARRTAPCSSAPARTKVSRDGHDAHGAPGRRAGAHLAPRRGLPRVPAPRRRAAPAHGRPHPGRPDGAGGRDHRDEAEVHPHNNVLMRASAPSEGGRRRGRRRAARRRPAAALQRRPHRHGDRGPDPGDPREQRQPQQAADRLVQGREPSRRHRQHHGRRARRRGEPEADAERRAAASPSADRERCRAAASTAMVGRSESPPCGPHARASSLCDRCARRVLRVR